MQTLYNNRFLRVLDFGGNPKSINEMVVDSGIIAAIAFFSSLAGTGYPPSPDIAWQAFIAFGFAFFTQLGYERGYRVFGPTSKDDGTEDASE